MAKNIHTHIPIKKNHHTRSFDREKTFQNVIAFENVIALLRMRSAQRNPLKLFNLS